MERRASDPLEFSINIRPVSKTRPRFSTQGGWARAITTKKVRHFENEFRRLSKKYRPKIPWTGPIHLIVKFYVPFPQKPKNKDWPTQRPDLDNYLKAVMDAMSPVDQRVSGKTIRTELGFWDDDSQVCQIETWKMYSYLDKEPHIRIQLQTLTSSHQIGSSIQSKST